MDVGTESREAEKPQDARFERARVRGAGDPGRELLEHVIQGASLDAEEEVSALDWLLGPVRALQYEMTVQVETDRGLAPLTFVFVQMDGSKVDQIEERNRSQGTGLIDRLAADAELVERATVHLESGTRRMELRSDEFLTVMGTDARGEPEPFKLASPAEALNRRFRFQRGLLGAVASEIRRVSGWDAERAGRAKRRQAQRDLVQASLD